jgi:anthranilate phosphoribosyltransferase
VPTNTQPPPNSFAHDYLHLLVHGLSYERAGAAGALKEILDGHVDPALVASFLTALTMKGVEPNEMAGLIDAMMASAQTISVDPRAIDIVGTGGDLLNTVNVSTMAAFVVAGCGVPVAKHGNRAASSSVGSADVLEALGVRIDAPKEVVAACVDQAGVGFMFAPTFHPGLSNLGPTRRALGFRTVFNVLGPLANPAQVRYQLIGVSSEHLLDSMSQVLLARGIHRAILVYGEDGMDELSLGGPSVLSSISEGTVTRSFLDAPEVLGIRRPASTLRGGDVAQNVRAVRTTLAGEPGPVRDVVCANASLALIVAGRTDSLTEGFSMALTSVLDGHAARALERLVEVSNS